jgi:phenylacetate-CoA ligase
MDAVEVHTELTDPGSTEDQNEAARQLIQRIKSYIGISAKVTVHEPGTVPRSEGKAKRVIDNRE